MRGDALIDWDTKLNKYMLDFVHRYETRRAKEFIEMYDRRNKPVKPKIIILSSNAKTK